MLSKRVSNAELKRDSLQDIKSVLPGFRLVEIAIGKVTGRGIGNHAGAVDFETARGWVLLHFSSRPFQTFYGAGKRRARMSRFSIGLVVLIIGLGLILAGGISYTTQDKTKIGPIAIEYPEHHHIPYSPFAGALLAVTGGALMLWGRARRHQA